MKLTWTLILGIVIAICYLIFGQAPSVNERVGDEELKESLVGKSPKEPGALAQVFNRMTSSDSSVPTPYYQNQNPGDIEDIQQVTKNDHDTFHELLTTSPDDAGVFVRSIVLNIDQDPSRRLNLFAEFQNHGDASAVLDLAVDMIAQGESWHIVQAGTDCVLNKQEPEQALETLSSTLSRVQLPQFRSKIINKIVDRIPSARESFANELNEEQLQNAPPQMDPMTTDQGPAPTEPEQYEQPPMPQDSPADESYNN